MPVGLEHLTLERALQESGFEIGQDTLDLQAQPYRASERTTQLDPLTGLALLGLGIGAAYGAIGTQALIESGRAPGPRDPALAVGLSAGTAASMVGLSYLWRSMGPLSFVGGLAPLGLSVGYAYAGEPERGGAVALGTYGVLVGTSVASWLAYEIFVPRRAWRNSFSDPITWGIYTGIGLTGLYVLWSLADVYQVAQRRR